MLEELILDVKTLIMETCELEDITPDDIDNHASLFNDGLGLDSIDALEIGVALQKKYAIEFSPESVETKQHFASVLTLVNLIQAHRG